MYVQRLELRDFRNYRAADVTLRPGVTIFQGRNGQGKTNLVEAIEYLSTLGSHRVSSDLPLVRAGASQAILRSSVVAGVDDPRSLLLEVEVNAHRPNRARINRGALPRMNDLIGALRTVVFSPEDLSVVKGEPAMRRRFIDELVVSRWPRMLGVKQDYDRVLRQRNALLKSLAAGEADASAAYTLEVWDDQLVSFGSEVLAARIDTLNELRSPAQQAYAAIAEDNSAIDVHYEPSFELPASGEALEPAFREGIARFRDQERRRGVSLVGPHRDEIQLSIGELPARGYASHGETWSFALALRLGAFALLRDDDIMPVLILDDVFAELDRTRRDRLAAALTDAEQLLITAAVKSDVPTELGGSRFDVAAGEISEGGSDE